VAGGRVQGPVKAAARRWAAQALLADGRPVDRLAIAEKLRGAG
jgi:hypothetical protein